MHWDEEPTSLWKKCSCAAKSENYGVGRKQRSVSKLKNNITIYTPTSHGHLPFCKRAINNEIEKWLFSKVEISMRISYYLQVRINDLNNYSFFEGRSSFSFDNFGASWRKVWVNLRNAYYCPNK